MFRVLLTFLLMLIVQPSWADGEREHRLKNGAKAFEYCANCHTLNGTDEARFGPDLLGVFGRPVASIETYHYSDSLKELGGTWIRDALNRFIANPTHAVEGSKMPFKGLMSPHTRSDLLDYLEAVGNGELEHVADVKDPLEVALEHGDAEKGALLFTQCLACHTATSYEGHKIGPNLYGVMRREVASAQGFNYSNRLRRRGGVWTPEQLNSFFFETKEFDQGSHAAYRNLNHLSDRVNLIAFLATLKD